MTNETQTTPEAAAIPINPQIPSAEEFQSQIQELQRKLLETEEHLGAKFKAVEELNGYLDAIAAIPEVEAAEGGCDEAVRNAIQALKKDKGLLSELLHVLGQELTTSEGAVQVAQRIIAERNDLKAKLESQGVQQVVNLPQIIQEEMLTLGERIKEQCAQEAGASGHWVRERVDVKAIVQGLK